MYFFNFPGSYTTVALVQLGFTSLEVLRFSWL